jgi:hypothetical protein
VRRLISISIALGLGVGAWYGLGHHSHRAEGLPATAKDFKRIPGLIETGDAGEFVIARLQDGQLPGFSADDHGSVIVPNIKPPQEQTEAFPILRVVCLHKNGDISEYYYWVVRASEGATWHVKKAWRASPDGRVLEEYSVQ